MTTATVSLPALRHRTTVVLLASQVLGGIGIGIGIAFATVVGARVGGDALGGLAATATVVGTALVAVPLTPLMSAWGRRPGLALAYLTGAAGAALTVLAALVSNYPLLLLGLTAFGGSSTASFQARFAAADLTPPDRRARAISLLVWATTIGAVLGPSLATPASRSVTAWGIPAAAGPFAWACAAFAAAAVIIAAGLRPDPLLTARALAPTTARSGSGSVWSGFRAVRATPMGRIALTTVAVVHTAMASVMSMTPLEMSHHGAGMDLIGLVVSAHVLGMYAFSPAMGWLADRVGRITAICVSVAFLAVAALLATTAGTSHTQSMAALFVLGLGWSAGLVAGSALLTDSVPAADRSAAQGLSDLVMSSAAALGTAVAGVVVAQAGYAWLNAAVILVLLCFAARTLRGRTAPATNADRTAA
ncbi:MFS transporter [Streptomyces massasporeus]|uniref:MFS transporter n=1 Tax=Streptomyces massasporeus TaxID=67324 RepID=UPI0033E1B9D1